MKKIVEDKYLSWSDPITNWIGVLTDRPYTWPTAARRTYVLTWPFSMIVRGVAIVLLLLAWLVTGAAGFTANRLACVWHGERSIWGD